MSPRMVKYLLAALTLTGIGVATPPTVSYLQGPTNPKSNVPCIGVASVVITGSPFVVTGGTNVNITGCNFGNAVGIIRICNSPVFAGATCVAQSTSAWANQAITVSSVTLGSLSTTGYWYVQTNSGSINATAPFAISLVGGGGGGGLDCSLATVRCVPSEYATGAACAAVTNAGDICLFAPGTYSNWNITRDGTLLNPISWLANGAVNVNGHMDVTGDYNKIIGFNFNGGGVNDVITLVDTFGVEVWLNTCANFVEFCVGLRGALPGTINQDNLIIGNTSNGNINQNNQHFGLFGPDNIASYNSMNQSGNDFFVFYGPRLRVTNNYGWGPNMVPINGQHSDFAQTGVCCGRTIGTDGFTLEANYYKGNPPSTDQHYTNLEVLPDVSGNYMSRRNITYNSESGLGAFFIQSWYIYNDLYIDGNQSSTSCGMGCVGIFLSNTPAGNSNIYNTGIIDFWGAVTNAAVYDASGASTDYNFAWDTQLGAGMGYFGAFAAEPNKMTTQEPLFINRSIGDFHPTAAAPQRNNGTALTTVTVGGTGVTSITVAKGGFFRGFNSNVPQYGGNLAEGDIITVGSTTVRIQSVSGNVLTLQGAVTASAGTPVYFGDSNTPARGPYNFKATYTITNSLSYSAPTVTATVNDPSIVRRVEFFVDGLPVLMDISAPYQLSTSGFASGTHAITAIARPLYADTTLAYTATMNVVIP